MVPSETEEKNVKEKDYFFKISLRSIVLLHKCCLSLEYKNLKVNLTKQIKQY